MALYQPSVVAGGDINPSRFITLDNSANSQVLESNSGDTKLLGITREGTKRQPEAGSSPLHAASGDPVAYLPYGDYGLLEIGSGGCTAGGFLKPDNDGKGVAATTGNYAGAITLETRNAGEKALVQVISPTVAP